MHTGRIVTTSVVTLGLYFFATQSFAQTFTYTQIDVPNSSLTRPFGINSLGQIVGLSRDGDGTPHGFLRYTNGTYLKFEYPGASFTNAMGINDQGQIVGAWVDSKGKTHTYLRLSRGPALHEVPPLRYAPEAEGIVSRMPQIITTCLSIDITSSARLAYKHVLYSRTP